MRQELKRKTIDDLMLQWQQESDKGTTEILNEEFSLSMLKGDYPTALYILQSLPYYFEEDDCYLGTEDGLYLQQYQENFTNKMTYFLESDVDEELWSDAYCYVQTLYESLDKEEVLDFALNLLELLIVTAKDNLQYDYIAIQLESYYSFNELEAIIHSYEEDFRGTAMAKVLDLMLMFTIKTQGEKCAYELACNHMGYYKYRKYVIDTKLKEDEFLDAIDLAFCGINHNNGYDEHYWENVVFEIALDYDFTELIIDFAAQFYPNAMPLSEKKRLYDILKKHMTIDQWNEWVNNMIETKDKSSYRETTFNMLLWEGRFSESLAFYNKYHDTAHAISAEEFTEGDGHKLIAEIYAQEILDNSKRLLLSSKKDYYLSLLKRIYNLGQRDLAIETAIKVGNGFRLHKGFKEFIGQLYVDPKFKG